MSTSKFKYPAGSVGDGTLRPQRVLEEGSRRCVVREPQSATASTTCIKTRVWPDALQRQTVRKRNFLFRPLRRLDLASAPTAIITDTILTKTVTGIAVPIDLDTYNRTEHSYIQDRRKDAVVDSAQDALSLDKRDSTIAHAHTVLKAHHRRPSSLVVRERSIICSTREA